MMSKSKYIPQGAAHEESIALVHARLDRIENLM
jgi:hypothetical protein